MSLIGIDNERIGAALYPGHFSASLLSRADDFDLDHVAQFQREGYLAFDSFFTAVEVAEGHQALSELIAGRIEGYKGFEWEMGVDPSGLQSHERERFLRKLWTFVGDSPLLNHFAHHPRLLSVIERLIGSPVKLIQDMALLKPPHIGGEKPWHQDSAYFVMEPIELVLGVWIALDRATPENGCMHVIPGTHLQGPTPHYHDRDCQLPDETVAVSRDTVVPLSPGGLLIFSSLLHHGTPANKSADRRRALQFHYASVQCTRMSNERHKELFQDPSRPEQYAACASHFTQFPSTKITER